MAHPARFPLRRTGTTARAPPATRYFGGGLLGNNTNARAGYGVCGANGQLFAFGGAGATPSAGAAAAVLTAPPPSLSANSWNNEGLTMTNLRYLMGSTVQSAFIFLVGGQTDALPATATTELVIW